MPETKTVPCLVLDPTGQRMVKLVKGEHASFGHPDWHCPDLTCARRGDCLTKEGAVTAYDDLCIRLDTRGTIHGVVWCEGGGNCKAR